MTSLSLDISSITSDFNLGFIPDIKRAANTTIELYAIQKKVSISILICDENYIQNLNNSYRGINQPTDVLSFTADIQLPESEDLYLGDIAISFPTAVNQAEKAGHPIENELVLLTVHGILHLLGYDHMTEEDEKVMWKTQRRIFDYLGYHIDLLSGDKYAQE